MTTISQARDHTVSPWTALVLVCGLWTQTQAHATEVRICTDHGSLTVDLLEEEAPLHTENFVRYVESGFYDGTVFHRVVGGAVIQGGGYDRTLALRMATTTVANESSNGIGNQRATVAAARTDDPDSATSQFFINLQDNDRLDATSRRPGYTVFGRVTEGMEVADSIGALPTGAAGPLRQEVPAPLPMVISMALLAAPDSPAADETSDPDELRELIDEADGDAAAQLDLIARYRATCARPDPALLVIESAAALALDQPLRARYRLDDYFATVDATDPNLAQAQALFRTLPPTEQMGIGPLIAHCQVPEPPTIPNGRESDLDTMVEAQAAVRRFVELGDAYLECLSEVIDEEALSDNQEVAAVGRHNETVELMERLAEEFNREVRDFRARQ